MKLSSGKESGLSSNRGDPDVIAREKDQQVCCVGAGRNVPAETPAMCSLVLLAFAGHADRRGKGERGLALYGFPLSHKAPVLRT